jgi:thiol-disulfide isomerase/thioredoxin
VVASTVDTKAEKSIAAAQKANAQSYVDLHFGQIFKDGMSFSGFERDKVWINTGTSFADLSDLSGADSPNDGRGVVAADFDDDGDVDLFVHEIQRERHALYRNDAVAPGSASHGFLKLVLEDHAPQRDAIGATVMVRTGARVSCQVVSRGAGFVSCQARELVFGLGDASQAEVEVIWPGGGREAFGRLAANTRATLLRGGKVVPRAEHPRPLADPMPPGLLVDEGDAFPVLAVLDAQAKPVQLDLGQLGAGKPVLLNLWGSFCSSCVAELPALEAAHRRGELVVVALSVDAPETRSAAIERLKTAKTSFPAFYLAPDGAGALLDLERLTLPTSVVVGADGRVQSILRGPLTQAAGPEPETSGTK